MAAEKDSRLVTRRGAIAIAAGAAFAAVAGAAAAWRSRVGAGGAGRPDAPATPFSPASDATTDASRAPATAATTATTPSATDLRGRLDLAERMYDDLDHGPKPADCQRYVVLHDTEGGGEPEDVIDWWESNGNLVAAHFVVGKDGHVAQCVPVDRIAHHAGFGDAGHNKRFGVTDESRDDRRGTSPIGSEHPDYGMNSYSIGIEMVHVGGEGDYPASQLKAVDALLAWLDALYAEKGLDDAGRIIDHKTWRIGNSDTSAEFAGYLANYRDHRTHLDA